MNVFWFIPTQGDGRFLGTTVGGRPATFDYFAQIAQAADLLGYSGVLLPTGRGGEDAWVTAAGLAPITKRLRYLVAVRPGLISPTLAYRMAATLDRNSNGRVLVNVVAGGDTNELRGDGLFLDHDQRYEQTAEFLDVWNGLARGETVSMSGRHVKVEGARQMFPPVQTPHIPLYFGGSSQATMQVAAKSVDVYLTWGEPPAAVSEKIQIMRNLAQAAGRTIRFGIRLHVVVRDTYAQAKRAAEELICHVTDEAAAAAQTALAFYESEGQRRMLELQKGGRDNLWLRPDLWTGVGLVRGGAGTAMVGDGATVAALMHEYAALGIDTFILSGYPHLEEAYHFAELVFPLLPGQQTPHDAQFKIASTGQVRIPGGANGQS